MRAELKKLNSPDVSELEFYQPSDPENFCFLLQAFVGPNNSIGEELFGITVCTPNWILENLKDEEIMLCRHLLITSHYDYKKIYERIKRLIESCEGENWIEVAQKVGRIGQWEFEDYRDN